MAFSKKDNEKFETGLKGGGWKQSSYDKNVWKRDGETIRKSVSEGNWSGNGRKDTDFSIARKSGKLF